MKLKYIALGVFGAYTIFISILAVRLWKRIVSTFTYPLRQMVEPGAMWGVITAGITTLIVAVVFMRLIYSVSKKWRCSSANSLWYQSVLLMGLFAVSHFVFIGPISALIGVPVSSLIARYWFHYPH